MQLSPKLRVVPYLFTCESCLVFCKWGGKVKCKKDILKGPWCVLCWKVLLHLWTPARGKSRGCLRIWWRWWWLFARVWGFWENIWPFIPCLHFFSFFFFFEVEISSCTLIPLFMPGSVHSGSVSWDDCGRMFPDKFRVSSFPDRFPHYAWTAS